MTDDDGDDDIIIQGQSGDLSLGTTELMNYSFLSKFQMSWS